jgi:hypothetical protein
VVEGAGQIGERTTRTLVDARRGPGGYADGRPER